uniref:hypothetical protein n=1 Tax=uncultured Allisonella sp. TaxID=339338 RepID=UPI0026701EF7
CLNKGKQKDITYFPLWRERDRRTSVESRTLYVRAKESVLIASPALSIKEAIRGIHLWISKANLPASNR